jgi:TRAP-type transport system periplasmic protein
VIRLALLALAMLAAADAQAVTVLTYATPYGPTHPFSRADKTWIKWVEEQSQGGLRIQPIWSGGLISSDQSMVELRHGVADIGLITPIYAHGGAHLLRVQTGFYSGAKTYEQQVALYRCLAATSPQYAVELKGLKILAIQGGTLPGLLTRTRQVKTLDDLKGLRLRVPTELLSVMHDLGADPVTLPMGEVYSGLAKGVLDGVVAPTDTLKSLHFGEVAKFYTRLEIPRGAYPARAMGSKRWESLSDPERAVLEAAIPVWEEAMARETHAAVASGEAEGHRVGVQFLEIAPMWQQRFDALYERDAAVNAKELSRFGIDGASIFNRSRDIAGRIRTTGQVVCQGQADAAT